MSLHGNVSRWHFAHPVFSDTPRVLNYFRKVQLRICVDCIDIQYNTSNKSGIAILRVQCTGASEKVYHDGDFLMSFLR